MATKARMIARLTRIAVSLRNTLDSIATPLSVKANGAYFGNFPRPSISKVTICDLNLSFNELYSMSESVNMKSSPSNRSMFLRTACFKTRVSTW